MNTNIEISRFEGATQRVGKACLSSCRKLIAQMKRAKDAVRAEFNGTLRAQEHLLQLALNEAEALGLIAFQAFRLLDRTNEYR